VVSGAVTTNKATISSIQTFMQGNLDLGVTSVGITFGTSGTDINASGSPVTSSGNITINLPTASATNRGALSSADWITFNAKQPAGNYVTLDTVQTITAQKTFTGSGSSDTVIISHGSGAGFALDVIKAGNNEAIRVTKTSGSGNAMTVIGGNFEAPTIVKTGGTSSQFLKADGSVDSSTYLTTGTAASTYLPLAGGTLTGALIGTTAAFSGNSTIGGSDGVATRLYVRTEDTANTPSLTLFKNISSSSTEDVFRVQSFTGGVITTASIKANGSANFLGNVGIGTNTPEATGLTIAGGGILVSLDSGAARRVLELYSQSGIAKVSASYVGASSYGDLQLLTSNLARLTIASTGEATFSSTVKAKSFLPAYAASTLANQNSGIVWTNGTIGETFGFVVQDGVYFQGDFNNTNNTFGVRAATSDGSLGSPVFVVKGSGNVGIGTANPDSVTNFTNLSINGTSGAFISMKINETLAYRVGTNSGEGYLLTTGAIPLVFYTNTTERMRITSGGDVLINTTAVAGLFSGENSNSGSATLQSWNKATSGDNKFVEFYTEGGGGTLRGSIDYNRAAGLVRYNVTSDKNLKNIIGDSNKNKSIEILNSTRIREYSWKDDESNKSQIGVIAQELHETFKGAVSVGSDEELLGTEDYKPWAVDKTAFTFHLVAGFQEHERIIKELQEQINSLKNQIK
jgi:hypothetical protein